MNYRTYTPADRAACLALYCGNAERFFSPGDVDDFAAFLDAPPGVYGVLEDELGNVAGCGGLAVREDGQTAVLTWGMIDEALHGQGLGRTLLLARLRLLERWPEVTRLIINTSQLAEGFYRKFGFARVRMEENGYRAGLDRIRMELIVTKV